MLKRMAPGHLLATAWRVFVGAPGLFLTSALLIFAPVLAARAFLLTAAVDPGPWMLAGLDLLTNLVLIPVTAAAVVFGVFRRLRGESASLGDCLRTGFRRAFAVALASLLMGLATVAGMCLLIIPGLIMASGLFVSIPALVVERRFSLDALHRSWDLTEGHRWQMFVLLVVMFLIGAGVGAAVGYAAPRGLHALGLSVEASLSGYQIILNLLLVPVYTFQAVLQGVAYYELRVGKEGVDTEELAAVFD